MDLPATAALHLSPRIQKLSFLQRRLILETREHEKLQLRATCCWVTPLGKRGKGWSQVESRAVILHFGI